MVIIVKKKIIGDNDFKVTSMLYNYQIKPNK